MSIRQTDGTVQAIVTAGQTWKSGEVRQAADGRLGVVANGPAIVGDGVLTATLHCATDIEIEMTTEVNLSAGSGGASVDVATQTIKAAGAGVNVKYVLSDAVANSKVRVILN